MYKFQLNIILLGLILFSSLSYADEMVIKMNSTDNSKVNIGTITAKDSPYGLLFIPDLHHLSPGLHGFHVHLNPTCNDHGMSAGGHLDPLNTQKHLGPYTDKGHLGDLPVLIADKDGRATLPLLAPRLKLKEIKKHALLIHAGGDNYSDEPPLGGGGARIACGVVE